MNPEPEEKNYWKFFKQGVNFLLLGIFVLFVASFLLKEELPMASEIVPELFQEPIQKETIRKEFSFDYRGSTYKVSPMYDYELWGMVASYNNINSWFDAYHTSDSVDTKDLCVLWGDNLKTNDFREWEITNTSWTCWWSWTGNQKEVNPYKLSNNHLLTTSPEIRTAIQNVQKGDQIHLKGMLVSYCNETEGCQGLRESSTSREDTGNRACEVFFVESFEVLKASTPLWSMLFRWTKILLEIVLFLRFLMFLWDIRPNGQKSLFSRKTKDSALPPEYNIGVLTTGKKSF